MNVQFSAHVLSSVHFLARLAVSLFVLHWRYLYSFGLGRSVHFGLDRPAECGFRWVGVADIYCCAAALNHQTALPGSQTLVFLAR